MNAFSVADTTKSKPFDTLDDWKDAVVDLFLNAANSFGLVKSIDSYFAGISPWRCIR
jgi:hypothetical protein